MQKILDAGSGLGAFISQLAKKQPADYYGVEIEPENIEFCKKHYPEINFQQMSVEDLKFQDNYFDQIHSRDVLEHVDDLNKTFSELVRVLKPGGKLCIQIPAATSERWLLGLRPTYHEEIHHVRIFEDSDLDNMAKNYPLRLLQKTPLGFTDHFYLYFIFKSDKVSERQTGIGSWREHWWGIIVAPIHGYLTKDIVFSTWLKYIPIWLISLPISWLINLIGNRFMPKSWYYEFEKVGNE